VGEHPHRGFETVTIVYQGAVEHRDSAGNAGTIRTGDVQWMTAASGIVHEEKHEKELIGMLTEDKLNYIGSIVLGLNDALVELTGALAGLTFALQDPKLIALTGTITGIAAAFSMGASEYLSTKSEKADGKHAAKASVFTGLTYILTVVALILPYLLLNNIYISLGLTLSIALLIIAAFNFYYSIVKDEKFTSRFLEMASLSMGVALLSFGVGLILRKFLGVNTD